LIEDVAMRLQDKRAIVTGGANGIGRATAELFAREGARVVIADRNHAAGSAAVEAICRSGGQAFFVSAEMTDENAVNGLTAQADALLGGVDVLVSNAGWSLTEDLLELEPDAWQADVQLNLTSHFFATRAALPIMIRGGGGSIVTISSVNALWCIGEFGYSAAKAGLISLTKNIAVTYGPQGIRANVICPGTIATEAGAAYWDQKAGAKEKLLKWYPLRRLGRPEDVAFMALYLASDESSFVSGATLVIDGGLTAGSRLFGNL
jgi:NAD(P)-dependent dehydrogenase (short-subunit alcohol dehydrogenase family)